MFFVRCPPPHTGLRSQTLSGKLKLTFVMSDLIFWCRTVFNMKDQVAQKLLVHYSSSSWEIFVPLLTNIYGWSWCVIGRLLTFKLRVKWISRSNQLSKCTSWYIIFNKFLEQAGAELCQAQYEIGDLNMISPLSLMYPASRAQRAPPAVCEKCLSPWGQRKEDNSRTPHGLTKRFIY